MQTALESLSKEELIANIGQQKGVVLQKDERIESLIQERDYLKSPVDMYRRMQFGQKRERFEGDPNQTMLPFEATPQETRQQQEEVREKIEYLRKRPAHHGRAKLPAHFPVEEIEIYPEGDLSEMVCMGKEITEELECEPTRFLSEDMSATNTPPKKVGVFASEIFPKGSSTKAYRSGPAGIHPDR